MLDLSHVTDLKVSGDWVIPAEKIQESIRWALENRRASAYFQRWGCDGGDVICVVDLFDEKYPTKSITNDAEEIVRLIHAIHGNLPIIYRDTDGTWDELRHRDGHFACFRSLASRDVDAAIKKTLALHEKEASLYAGGSVQ